MWCGRDLQFYNFQSFFQKALRVVLKAVDEYGIIPIEVPVAQWIEHSPPKRGAQVQFLSGTLTRWSG